MTNIDEIKIKPMSGKVFKEATNGEGWTRNVPWPVDDLGVYGDNESTDEDLDEYIKDRIGVWPGDPVDGGDCRLVFSACAGRDHDLKPVIILSLRRER